VQARGITTRWLSAYGKSCPEAGVGQAIASNAGGLDPQWRGDGGQSVN
jgi:hypothetical protein